jgi:hypothetical protein
MLVSHFKSSIIYNISLYHISLVRHSQLKLHNNVAVCITDKASMVFGGSDDPLALGCVYSLGKSAGSLSLSVILTLKYKI